MIHPLCDDINDFDDCKSFTEKILRNESGFYLSRNCAIPDSLRYLLVTTQKTVKKEEHAKFAGKDIRLLSTVITLKSPKKNLKKLVRKEK